MSKFCFGCGAFLDDDAIFCARCGARIDAPFAPAVPQPPVPATKPAAEPATPVPTPPPQPPEVVPAPAKKSKKSLFVGIAALVLTLGIGLLVWFVFIPDPCAKPIDLYIDAVMNCDPELVEQMGPPEYWQWREDRLSPETSHLYNDFESALKSMQKDLQEHYGEDAKIAYDILKKKPLPEDDLACIVAELEDVYEIDPDSVEKAYTLYVEFSVSGDKDEMDTLSEVAVIMIDNQWYWISYYIGKEFCSVSFRLPSQINPYSYSSYFVPT